MREVLRSGSSLHLAAVTLLPLSLLLAGCERVPKPETASAAAHSSARSGTAAPALSQWRRLAASPMSARERAVSVTVGGRALFFGGTSAPDRCPPPGDCSAQTGDGFQGPAFQDGAAYDPAADTWATLASSPVPFGDAASSPTTAVVGTRVYVLASRRYSGRPPETDFLAYDAAKDQWATLPPPAGDDHTLRLAALGNKVAAFATTHQNNIGVSPKPGDPVPPDLVFDPSTSTWTALPAAPHSPAFDRQATSAGTAVVLLSRDLVENPGSGPPVTRTAILESKAGSAYAWRSLPDGESLATGGFLYAAGQLVNIGEASADGGEVSNWGRDFFEAAALDVASGAWSALPQRAHTGQLGGLVDSPIGGARTVARGNWIYDVPNRSWLRLPSPAGEDRSPEQRPPVTRRSQAWVDTPSGGTLVLWGGVRWAAGTSSEGIAPGTPLSDGWQLDVKVPE